MGQKLPSLRSLKFFCMMLVSFISQEAFTYTGVLQQPLQPLTGQLNVISLKHNVLFDGLVLAWSLFKRSQWSEFNQNIPTVHQHKTVNLLLEQTEHSQYRKEIEHLKSIKLPKQNIQFEVPAFNLNSKFDDVFHAPGTRIEKESVIFDSVDQSVQESESDYTIWLDRKHQLLEIIYFDGYCPLLIRSDDFEQKLHTELLCDDHPAFTISPYDMIKFSREASGNIIVTLKKGSTYYTILYSEFRRLMSIRFESWIDQMFGMIDNMTHATHYDFYIKKMSPDIKGKKKNNKIRGVKKIKKIKKEAVFYSRKSMSENDFSKYTTRRSMRTVNSGVPLFNHIPTMAEIMDKAKEYDIPSFFMTDISNFNDEVMDHGRLRNLGDFGVSNKIWNYEIDLNDVFFELADFEPTQAAVERDIYEIDNGATYRYLQEHIRNEGKCIIFSLWQDFHMAQYYELEYRDRKVPYSENAFNWRKLRDISELEKELYMATDMHSVTNSNYRVPVYPPNNKEIESRISEYDIFRFAYDLELDSSLKKIIKIKDWNSIVLLSEILNKNKNKGHNDLVGILEYEGLHYFLERLAIQEKNIRIISADRLTNQQKRILLLAMWADISLNITRYQNRYKNNAFSQRQSQDDVFNWRMLYECNIHLSDEAGTDEIETDEAGVDEIETDGTVEEVRKVLLGCTNSTKYFKPGASSGAENTLHPYTFNLLETAKLTENLQARRYNARQSTAHDSEAERKQNLANVISLILSSTIKQLEREPKSHFSVKESEIQNKITSGWEPFSEHLKERIKTKRKKRKVYIGRAYA